MWTLNHLTEKQIISILQLLHSSYLQQQVYIDFKNPYREFLPFWENAELQQTFFKGYARHIKQIPPEYYRGIILPR